MDSLTHIALGACMGEAFAGRQLGRKAMLWGAIAQCFPDIDFLASFWMDTSSDLLAHRGFTHSFLCWLLVTPFFALIAERWHGPHDIPYRRWLIFFGGTIFVHLFIDAFNNYGIGWLEPFSHVRISFNAVYVADPFLSIWPIAAWVILLILQRNHPRRPFWVRFGLLLPAVYLLYCGVNKWAINRQVKQSLEVQSIPYQRYFSTPAPLQNWLWFVVAGNDSGYHVGFRSLFDREKATRFEYFPRNDSLLGPYLKHEDLHQLIRFSQQYYTVERWGDTVVFNDLRFGQMIGWTKPREHFVFHYFLKEKADNTLVVQRGRFAGWDWDVFLALLRRIRGN